MSATLTLIGTPDPDRATSLPAPAGCSCIFSASTAGPLGMDMRVDGVVDPDCARHRTVTLPQQKQYIGMLDRMERLRRRAAGFTNDLTAPLVATARPKLA